MNQQNSIGAQAMQQGNPNSDTPFWKQSKAADDPKLTADLKGYRDSIFLIYQAIQNGLESANQIQNGVQRARFSKFLKECEKKFELIARDIETAKPIHSRMAPIKISAQLQEKKMNDEYEHIKNTSLTKEDKDRILRILEDILKGYREVFFVDSSTAVTPPKPPEDPKIAAAKASTIRACFDRALAMVEAEIDIHPSVFINYSWGVIANEKKVKQMYLDLTNCGINTRFDHVNNTVSTQILSGFIEEINARDERRVDYIIVSGSPELYEKYNKRDDNVVRIELELIATRYKENKDDVIPVLVDGDYREAFPGYLGGGINIVFANISDKEIYYAEIWKIIFKLLENSECLDKVIEIKNNFDLKFQYIKENKLSNDELLQLLEKDRALELRRERETKAQIISDHTAELERKTNLLPSNNKNNSTWKNNMLVPAPSTTPSPGQFFQTPTPPPKPPRKQGVPLSSQQIPEPNTSSSSSFGSNGPQ